MIPLRDSIPSRSLPLVNYALIVGNVVAFAYQISLGSGLERWVLHHALVPARFWGGLAHLDPAATLWPVLLSMFLHGGWMHIIGNMLYLWIFGDNIEDRLGHAGYLVFYVFAGLMAALGQLFASPRSTVPMVGASGAIAGVMGAYFVLYPRARVLTAVPIFFFVEVFEIPAVVFLFFWIAMQFLSGSVAVLSGTADLGGGVAWWAHIGGFVAGVAVALWIRGRDDRRGRLRAPLERGW